MTLEEARILVHSNINLVGREVYGKPIDELIILPTDKTPQQIFFKIYLDSLDAEEALEPFYRYDLVVRCILNKNMIDRTNTISSLPLEKALSILKKCI